MKALLITGTLAENTVKQYAKQSSTPTEVMCPKRTRRRIPNPANHQPSPQKSPPQSI